MTRILLLTSVVALSDCGNRAPEPASVASLAEARASRASDDTLPPRIYYNLNDFGWYARAEPIVHRQQRYSPRGAPLAIPLAKLEVAGNYQGVDYYVLHHDSEPPNAIYVPVYEGYWLSFVVAPSLGD